MSQTAPDRSLTRGRLLARNILLNLGGSVLPAVAALAAVPFLVRGLGDSRFGLLTLAWTALGYFSLFDMGMSRAVTHAVADGAGRRGHAAHAGEVVWTALAIVTPVGIIGAVVLFAAAPWLVATLGVPPEMRAEAILAFRVLAVAVPFAAIAGALRGALEGMQFFGVVNALRIPHGLVTFLGPLAALPFTRSLVPAMVILTGARVALSMAHWMAARRLIPELRQAQWSGGLARRLLTFGGWLQVTAVVSPLMATLDRFVVGGMLGIGLVAYYATPHELVTKLWLFLMAAGPVFFSALATTGMRDPERSAALFDRLMRVTIALLFLPALVLVALAPDILRTWLGPGFVAPSTELMQVLTIAVFVNCVGQCAYTLIQALGRPDLTGKYHLAELPLYAVLLLWLLPTYGILGAAIAWSVRTVGDTVLLLATAPRLLRESRGPVLRAAAWTTALAAVLGVAMASSHSGFRFLLVLLAMPVWAAVVWRRLLTAEERALIQRPVSGEWLPGRA